MKICGIYKITSPSNKIYIGQSVNIVVRWGKYMRYACKQQPSLYNSFVKYGVKEHKFEILCQCDKSELNNLEIYYIDLYQSFNTKFGINLKSGGTMNKFSDETKLKMRNAKLGKKRPPITISHRNNLSKSKIGKQFTNEHKNNLKNSSFRKNVKPIYQIDMITNKPIKMWHSSVEAGVGVGIDCSQIAKCCKGNYGSKTAGGFKWRYVKNN